jgi:hypothetical protein
MTINNMADELITQEDIDLAEQDLRDREDDFTGAYAAMHVARLEVLKAKRHRDELRANFKDHGTHRKE